MKIFWLCCKTKFLSSVPYLNLLKSRFNHGPNSAILRPDGPLGSYADFTFLPWDAGTDHELSSRVYAEQMVAHIFRHFPGRELF